MELTAHPVRLPAIEPPWATRARADPHFLGDVAHAVLGPFHVLNPARFAENVTAFNAALDDAGVDGQVFFGKKANKSACFVRACAEAGAGVDVASEPELADALGHGVRGEDIVVTGAAKNADLLWLAWRHGSLIAVDALDELERVIAMADAAAPVRILLRVLPAANPHSRFGLDPAEVEHAVDRCVEEQHRVVMEGFSFHLNGYEVAPRAALAADLVDRCLAARARGLAARSISIGGGFAVSYASAEDWRQFTDSCDESWFHGDKTFSHFYPYHQSPTGARMLAAIIASPAARSTGSLGERLAATGTRLLVEPGRALLDGSGFTVFPVQGFKKRDDHGIVTVLGLSMSVSEQWKGSEFLPDPMLWPDSGDRDAMPVLACVGGASCLEYDMLTWRKVHFGREPKFGDLLIYPNTAGYQMDKNETEFHQLPLPTRVVASADHERIHWRLDRHA